MDFKSLISKLDSMDAPPETPQAPTLPKSIQLDEDIALHVLAGTKTINEAADLMEKKLTAAEKEKKEEVVKSMKKDKAGFKERYGKRGEEVMHATATKIAKKKEESTDSEEEAIEEDSEMKVGDTKKTSTGGTLTKTEKGVKHTAKEYDGEDHVEPAQKKASKAGMTGAERREQKSADKEQEKDSKEWEKKHGKGSVTRHKMKDDVQIDPKKFLNKFMEMVEEAKKPKTMKEADKKVKSKKTEEKMDEASKPDFLDIDKDGDKKEPMKKAAKEAGNGGKKEMSDKQKKFFGKKDESISKEVKRKAKKIVAESIEVSLAFRDMIKLVKESGGQQQIDPLDKELFAWASRIAKSKFNEGAKAEVYAGLVYERMGGVFEMYDVLSEDQK
jgi:hypothetical protein